MSLKELDARYRELNGLADAMRRDGRDRTESEAFLRLLREICDVAGRRVKASGVVFRVMRATGE